MNIMTKKLLVLLLILLMNWQVEAVPVLGEVWGSLTPMNDWNALDVGQPVNSVAANYSDTGVSLTFPNGGGSPSATLLTDSADPYFTGDYTTLGAGNLALTFTFNPVDVVPDAGNGGLRLYFVNDGRTWSSVTSITPLATGPRTYSVFIGDASYWTPDGNYAGMWGTDFASVDSIGFLLTGPNGGVSQEYQFYDMKLHLIVPEPESVWMALIVLASLGITFRGRLSEMASQVKARIKA